MMTSGITSKQQDQIRRLVEVAAGNATLAALEKVVLDFDTAQMRIIEKGGQLQEFLLSEMTASVVKALNKLSGRKHPVAEDLEKYFREVLGYQLDLSGISFPEKNGFGSYMVAVPNLDEDEIMNRVTSYFKVNAYSWQSPIAQNIDRKVEQKRPDGIYVLAHRGGEEPDTEHLGKSYDDAVRDGVIFLNPKEYLLVAGFHMWKYGRWMDSKGWTRTSSVWSGGSLVRGRWDPSNGKLYLDYGDRDSRNSGLGPRELFLG